MSYTNNQKENNNDLQEKNQSQNKGYDLIISKRNLNKIIKVFPDSNPSKLSFDFCKENDLDYLDLDEIKVEIEKVITLLKNNKPEDKKLNTSNSANGKQSNHPVKSINNINKKKENNKISSFKEIPSSNICYKKINPDYIKILDNQNEDSQDINAINNNDKIYPQNYSLNNSKNSKNTYTMTNKHPQKYNQISLSIETMQQRAERTNNYIKKKNLQKYMDNNNNNNNFNNTNYSNNNNNFNNTIPCSNNNFSVPKNTYNKNSQKLFACDYKIQENKKIDLNNSKPHTKPCSRVLSKNSSLGNKSFKSNSQDKYGASNFSINSSKYQNSQKCQNYNNTISSQKNSEKLKMNNTLTIASSTKSLRKNRNIFHRLYKDSQIKRITYRRPCHFSRIVANRGSGNLNASLTSGRVSCNNSTYTLTLMSDHNNIDNDYANSYMLKSNSINKYSFQPNKDKYMNKSNTQSSFRKTKGNNYLSRGWSNDSNRINSIQRNAKKNNYFNNNLFTTTTTDNYGDMNYNNDTLSNNYRPVINHEKKCFNGYSNAINQNSNNNNRDLFFSNRGGRINTQGNNFNSGNSNYINNNNYKNNYVGNNNSNNNNNCFLLSPKCVMPENEYKPLRDRLIKISQEENICLQEAKELVFKNLFNDLINYNSLNELNKDTICLDYIPQNIQSELNIIIYNVTQKYERYSFESFCKIMNDLFNNLSFDKRRCIMNRYKTKNFVKSTDENMKINSLYNYSNTENCNSNNNNNCNMNNTCKCSKNNKNLSFVANSNSINKIHNHRIYNNSKSKEKRKKNPFDKRNFYYIFD